MEESAILKKFFQILIEESEVGYVLLGKKPVCIHGFFSKDPFLVNTPIHKQSVALREGARIWKKNNNKKSDIFIHICKKEDPYLPGYIHILSVRKSLFEKVVEENLTLFQYVLGPSITPQNLFEKFLEDDQTYYSLLKKDKVLIGSLLGFGIHNSLCGSRIENIQETAEEDIPPFLNSRLVVLNHDQEYLPFPPAFNFTSVSQELQLLEDKMKISSPNLMRTNPKFIFGCLKGSREVDECISDLEDTQSQIQSFLRSSDFLEKTLEQLTGQRFKTVFAQNFRFEFDKDKINKLVARGLWESVQKYDKEFLSYFIKGIESQDILCDEIPRLAYFSSYRRDVIEAKSNLEKTADLFRSFEYEKDVTCVIPQKLYYRTLKRGHSEIKCIGPLVSLEFSIFSPLGHCLNYQSNKLVNLKNTIPGFAHGVKGMKVGETREIFIHPSLGYGFETSLDKCTSLRAVVTLLETHENHDSFSPVQSIDLSFLSDEGTLIERTENYKKALMGRGKQISDHLQKSPQVDLGSVCEHLKNFQNDLEEFLHTTDEEQAIINQVHWNIYFSRESAN